MTKMHRLIIIALILVALTVPATWFGVQRSDAYRVATSHIDSDPRVREYLGELQSVHLPMFGYSLRMTGARGDANFTLDLAGSRASGTAYVELTKQGAWQPSTSRLVVQDGTVIQLTP